jgi:[acyl-carrier-protein] S-malonyltransferase
MSTQANNRAAAQFVLCPGQGAQTVGMGKDFYDSYPAARETFEAAGRVLGFDLAAICFSGPEERLSETDVSQPAIYVTSVACFRAAAEVGVIDASRVTAFAGLSLGEYTALHLAGAFDFEDGLKLVAARGRFMQEAAIASPSGMVALIGADRAAASALCEQCAQGDVLVPANFNAPGQIVVSGSRAACERVLKAAEVPGAGFRATALKVAGAFHSPLMQPAADRMKVELDRAAVGRPAKEVFSNVTAGPHGDVERIKELLVEQIVSPVLWEDTMVAIIGVTGATFVELAPGRTLAGLAKRINRRLPIEGLDKAEALKKVAAS